MNQGKWKFLHLVVLFVLAVSLAFLVASLKDANNALAAFEAEDLRIGQNLVANCVILEQRGYHPAPTLEEEVVFCRALMGDLLADDTWRGIDELVELITGERAAVAPPVGGITGGGVRVRA